MDLSVSLTSQKACTITFAKTPFELRIYSGTDRIWSTNDCAKIQLSGTLTLQPGRAWQHVWRWPTQRSSKGCSLSDEYLGPGTYVATAVLSGGRPRQHVFQLVG